MVHSFGKLVSKLLAIRLAPQLPNLVANNQTAFVRGRALHDSYKFVQAASVLFRKKNIPTAMLKIDISKAFDTISWKFLLEVLQALGFGQRWRDWVAILLASASSCLLLNSPPGPKIAHRRSLSPMLFILAMDALNLGSIHFPTYSLLWKSWMPLRVKIFVWLAFRRRHWTADRRRRHGLDAREYCWLCDREPESCDHLLFRCPFAREVWQQVLAKVGRQIPPADDCHGLPDWWLRYRAGWPSALLRGADTLFGLVCWSIWKQRNACCFRGEQASVASVLLAIRDTAELWILGEATGLGAVGLI